MTYVCAVLRAFQRAGREVLASEELRREELNDTSASAAATKPSGDCANSKDHAFWSVSKYV